MYGEHTHSPISSSESAIALPEFVRKIHGRFFYRRI